MSEKLLSPEQAAEQLGVTPNTVRTWLRDGSLKGIKLGKKIWRIKESELLDFINRETKIESGVVKSRGEFSDEDIKSVRRGLEDIKSGRLLSLDEYVQGKRP